MPDALSLPVTVEPLNAALPAMLAPSKSISVNVPPSYRNRLRRTSKPSALSLPVTVEPDTFTLPRMGAWRAIQRLADDREVKIDGKTV